MDEALDAIVTSIYNNQVPQVWIKSGFLSMKPLMSWIKDLNERSETINVLEENILEKLYSIHLRNDLLYVTPKHRQQKGK